MQDEIALEVLVSPYEERFMVQTQVTEERNVSASLCLTGCVHFVIRRRAKVPGKVQALHNTGLQQQDTRVTVGHVICAKKPFHSIPYLLT